MHDAHFSQQGGVPSDRPTKRKPRPVATGAVSTNLQKDYSLTPVYSNTFTEHNGKSSAKPGQNQSPQEWTLAKIKDSGLDKTDAKALGFMPYTEAKSALLNLPPREGSTTGGGAGFQIPYRDLNGDPLDTFRYRYQFTEVLNGWHKGLELKRYAQPFDSDPEIYLPHLPGVDWPAIAAEESIPLYITEGELKAACATKHGFTCIGLGGVWNFSRKKRFQDWLPSLEKLRWPARRVYICYDSDAVMKQYVLLAEYRLARKLADLGAIVHVVRIPPNKDNPEKKVALDDYIVAHGRDAFAELVEKTPEWGPARKLHELNTEVVYVRNPSMVVEYPKDNHPKDQPRYRSLRVPTFIKEVYANRRHTITTSDNKQKERSTAEEWIKWSHRSEVDSITYAPGKDLIIDGNQLNTWHGWGCEPKAGDVSLFLQLFNNLTEGLKDAERKWLLQWFAYPLQNPGARLNTAVVMWTPITGVGKSLLGYTMREIYGAANFSEVTRNQLESTFNAWQRHKQFVLGEEITGNDSKDVNRLADILKHYITGHTVLVNGKYTPEYELPNTVNYYFTSNRANCFEIKDDDRRYFIHEIVSEKLSDKFFRRYDNWFKSAEGAGAIFHYLLNVDTSDFNSQAAPPRTSARDAMIEAGLNAAGRLAHNLLKTPAGGYFGNGFSKKDIWTLQQIIQANRVLNSADDEVRRINEWSLGPALKEAGFRPTRDAVPIPGNATRARLWPIFNREKYEDSPPSKIAKAFVEQWGETMGKMLGKKDRKFQR